LQLLYKTNSTIEEILDIVVAPDYPGGANIISSIEEIADVYKSGNGSIRQMAVYEYDNHCNVVIKKLPHQVSSAAVMEHIA
ncbi:DNA gyrase subunit A, partial [Francisella tularensis]|uniref:DNA gyrase subunit A n=1 Tax=Francisella tularensis TaxID=263 RepID=UPI002381C5B4